MELWYGRWLEEMKEKVSHVCSQNNRRVSDLNTNILLEISRVKMYKWSTFGFYM